MKIPISYTEPQNQDITIHHLASAENCRLQNAELANMSFALDCLAIEIQRSCPKTIAAARAHLAEFRETLSERLPCGR